MERRTVLRFGGVALATAIAGCETVGLPDPTTRTGGGEPADTADTAPGSRFEVTETGERPVRTGAGRGGARPRDVGPAPFATVVVGEPAEGDTPHVVRLRNACATARTVTLRLVAFGDGGTDGGSLVFRGGGRIASDGAALGIAIRPPGEYALRLGVPRRDPRLRASLRLRPRLWDGGRGPHVVGIRADTVAPRLLEDT